MRTTTMRRPARAAVALLMSAGLLVAGASGASALGSGDATSSLGSLGSLDLFGSLGLGGEVLAPTPVMAGMSNFRDIAGKEGVGYQTVDGRHMNRGVIYRSNTLKDATDADLQTLSGLGVTHVYDFRSDWEITSPDVGGENKIPDGATGVHSPIDFGDLATLAQTFQSPADSIEFMEKANRGFVTDASKRAAFAAVLTGIANNGDPQIFNCTSGKDRTGWTAMLLQHIAGLSDADIMKDYLLSNERLAETNAQTIAYIKMRAPGPQGEFLANNLAPMLDVQESFLQAGLDQAAADYGDIDSYIKDGLGLSDATIAELKDKLVG